jgi:hypothetical protein
MRTTLPYQDTAYSCPQDVLKYLQHTGWTYTTLNGKYYFMRGDTIPSGYFTWSEAVTYNLIKPYMA